MRRGRSASSQFGFSCVCVCVRGGERSQAKSRVCVSSRRREDPAASRTLEDGEEEEEGPTDTRDITTSPLMTTTNMNSYN